MLRKLITDDTYRLCTYLQQLSPETRRRFGPHGFDRQTVESFYAENDTHSGYVAEDTENGEIIAYSILKTGYLWHDLQRLQSYGLTPDSHTDGTFAPSVTDPWQSQGVGNSLFQFILPDARSKGIKRIILWGGVQSDNIKAVNFYLKNGFTTLGEFEYFGMNTDMVLNITD